MQKGILNPVSFELQVSVHHSNLQMWSEPFENISSINLPSLCLLIGTYLTSLEKNENGLDLCNNMFQMTVDNKLWKNRAFKKGLKFSVSGIKIEAKRISF